jgi:glycosyltransferase involved in cell wall biosynthesis
MVDSKERREGVRIAFVGTELSSILNPTGGLEKLVQGWAREIGKRHNVFLVDMRPTTPQIHDFFGIPVLSASSPHQLPEIVNQVRADIVQTNNRPMWDTGSAQRVNTFHNFPNAWTIGEPVSPVQLTSALLEGVVTAVSNTLARHIEQIFNFKGGHVRTTPPFVDSAFLEMRYIGGSGPLFPNRLIDKKGPRIVLEALDSLGIVKTSTFCDYVTPSLLASYEYLKNRDLVLSFGASLIPQMESPDELALKYAEANIVIAIATEPEGMGLVPLEAQAVGAPVVTAGPGGLSEATFRPNVYLQIANRHSLAAAIDSTLLRPGLTRTKELIRSRFSLETSAESLENSW